MIQHVRGEGLKSFVMSHIRDALPLELYHRIKKLNWQSDFTEESKGNNQSHQAHCQLRTLQEFAGIQCR